MTRCWMARLPAAWRVAGSAVFLAAAGPAAAQDANFNLPVEEVERRLREEPLEVLRSQDTRFEGDRTKFVTLQFAGGEVINVKWATAPGGGGTFNNQPRYEVAAYELQKLFLDPSEYVVPPTVARVVPLEWYREVEPDGRATFSNTTSVLAVLQYWLNQASPNGVWDEERAGRDTVYARHVGNLNILTYLIRHADSNQGNFFISEYDENPRVFAVDNGVAFRSQESNRGTFWMSLHVDRLPAHTIQRLRELTRAELDERLGVLAQYRVEDGRLVPEAPGANLDPGRGVRITDGTIQLGLSDREIREVADRLEDLLRDVEREDFGLFGALRPHARPDPERVEGEHGLVVRVQNDSLRVSWLTGSATEGLLQVVRDDRVRHDLRTPSGTAHSAAFPRQGGDDLLLRYGGADRTSGLYRTRVRVDAPRRPRVSLGTVDSLYVMGDVHGELDTLVAVLQNAGLLDAERRWNGGRRHLAFVGDVMDRGADVSAVLWLLYRLEEEARDADGGVHLLLGNHEIMPLLNDLRYVAPKELAVAERHGIPYHRLYDPRRSVLGRWLASRPAMMRIGPVLLAHGGVAPALMEHSLGSYDDVLADFMAEDVFYNWSDTTYVAPLDSAGVARRAAFFFDDESVFWFRGYIQTDTLGARLDNVLDHFDATLHVVGHTPAETITPYYGGRVLGVNTVPFAAELLLLVRGEGNTPVPYRIRSTGPPERVDPPTGG